MDLSTQSGMCDAFQAGLERYQPTHSGLSLCMECGDPDATAANVERLGRPIVAALNGRAGVLLFLDDGQLYYATGFGVGGGSRTEKLVEALVRWKNCVVNYSADELTRRIEGWPQDLHGALPIYN